MISAGVITGDQIMTSNGVITGDGIHSFPLVLYSATRRA
jgi:hypothetical protein